MALETVVFQQDPFSYACKDFYNIWGLDNLGLEGIENVLESQVSSGIWESSNNSSSPDGSFVAGEELPAVTPIVMSGRRKRRRTKSFKNKEEMENQRMTHIAVERNRRRQMNDYLAILRSLMPPSYAQRGDQASIVGGAINFVKELEQLLQFLESHKLLKQQQKQTISDSHPQPFSNFFTFPQYSTSVTGNRTGTVDGMGEKPSKIADIEVTMAESHANIKLLTRSRPKQLLTLVTGFHSLSLTVLHLNITTFDQMVLFSFSVKVEDDCQLTSVNDIATAVHELVGMIQEEAVASRFERG